MTKPVLLTALGVAMIVGTAGADAATLTFMCGGDKATFEKASNAKLEPQYIADTLAFMFETRYPLIPTAYAGSIPALRTSSSM